MSKRKRREKPERGLYQALIQCQRCGVNPEHPNPEYATAETALLDVAVKNARVIQIDYQQLELFAMAFREELASNNRTNFAIEAPFDTTLVELLNPEEGACALTGLLMQRFGGLRDTQTVMPLYHLRANTEIMETPCLPFGFVVTEKEEEDVMGVWHLPMQEDHPEYGQSREMLVQNSTYAVALTRLLECANVGLAQAEQQYPVGHVAHKHGVVKHVVDIRQTGKRYAASVSPDSGGVFTHRFERRGNFAHHYELTAAGTLNRVFAKWSVDRPDKIIQHNGQSCVRIWRPPTIVGPEDKPLVPKTRRVV